MYLMKVKDLKKACVGGGYLLLHTEYGNAFAINKRVSRIAARRNGKKYDNRPTIITGFRECSFNEYITYKTPFVVSAR